MIEQLLMASLFLVGIVYIVAFTATEIAIIREKCKNRRRK